VSAAAGRIRDSAERPRGVPDAAREGQTGLTMTGFADDFPDLRRWTERWPAAALVLRLFALASLSLAIGRSHEPVTWALGVVAAAAGIVWALAAARRTPAAVAAAAGFGLCGAVLAGTGLAEPTGLTYVFMSLLYLRAFAEPRVTAVYVGVAILLTGAISAVATHNDGKFPLVIAVGGFVLGDARRSRRLALQRAQDLLAMTRRANAEQAHAAALAERGRIARDVHDVLAHSLSGLAIQLEAADALLTDGSDVERAHTMVIRARRLARDGLVEVRRAVTALREDVKPPQETLAALVADHAADTGWPASFEVVDGPVPELSVETAQTLQRVTQEALTNARKHAPGAAVDVRLAVETDTVTLTAENEPPTVPTAPLADSGGHWGLLGLRERVGLVGGTVEAGPTAGGGFRVVAVVPIVMVDIFQN
jgi:signal transduction histidine kinase